jgi:hypothetical protein
MRAGARTPAWLRAARHPRLHARRRPHARRDAPIHVPRPARPAQLSLDDYDTIRLINYIRRAVAGGADPRPALAAAAAGSATAPRPWASDEFLAPAVEDDPLLGYDFDEDAAEEGCAGAAAGRRGERGGGSGVGEQRACMGRRPHAGVRACIGTSRHMGGGRATGAVQLCMLDSPVC